MQVLYYVKLRRPDPLHRVWYIVERKLPNELLPIWSAAFVVSINMIIMCINDVEYDTIGRK